ncbi:hypothetical protein THTE_2476 [Thermogutta terrifontis]|uniref:Uncharacterized protein n=1 Tax=Thermogutta terrifontis TaxID=1331910 RepID=A0A286RGI6_9BACT|nr:hypothetical protein THTE_2476 [Thermogutta terrifontis]
MDEAIFVIDEQDAEKTLHSKDRWRNLSQFPFVLRSECADYPLIAQLTENLLDVV